MKGIEKLLDNPEEKRQVLMSCMGILAGLARARHQPAIEVRKAEKLEEEVKSLPAQAVLAATRGYDPPRFAPIQRKIREVHCSSAAGADSVPFAFETEAYRFEREKEK